MNKTKNLLTHCLLACWMLAAAPLSTSAQSVDALSAEAIHGRYSKIELEKFASQLEGWHQDRRFNGTVLIAVKGEIVFEKMVGYCDLENNDPLQSDSSFRLASVSKQFTAMGIMLLQQDGKLDFDDEIQKHLPELPYHGVTIRHLLNHTGGLPDYMGLFLKHWDSDKPFASKKIAVNKDAVELFAKHQPEPKFPPGEKWEYSNTGYVLLGSVIERVSGKSPQEFLKQRIFEPLRMRDSRAFDTDDRFKLNSRVYGFLYNFDGKTQLPNDWHFLNGMIGDGGVYASARDLLKWDQALYGETLVKKTLLDEAFTSGKLNDGSETEYGFGWQISKSPTGDLQISHGGGWVGFRTFIFREPASKLTCIVLSNCSTMILSKVIDELEKLDENVNRTKESSGK
jgi:CubicO group peptidase (beta-lactamase class C family)